MKQVSLLIFFTAFASIATSQSRTLDSLKRLLSTEMADTTRVNLYVQICDSIYMTGSNEPDSALLYAEKAVELSKRIRWKVGEAKGTYYKGGYYWHKYNYPMFLTVAFEALEVFEKEKDTFWIIDDLRAIGILYFLTQDYRNAVRFLQKSYSLAKATGNTSALFEPCYKLAESYYQMNLGDSALIYYQECDQIINRNPTVVFERLRYSKDALSPWIFSGLAKVYYLQKDYELSKLYCKKGLIGAEKSRGVYELYENVFSTLANVYLKETKYDSALFYGLKSLSAGRGAHFPAAYDILPEIFEKINKDSAIKYYKLKYALRDSLLNSSMRTQMMNVTQNELNRQKQKEIEAKKELASHRRSIQYTGISIAIGLIVILFLLYSQSIIASARLIKFLGLFVLLIVFEFINLIIHPYLAHVTGDSPLLILLTMVGIAALLIPAHHKIEHWVTHQLVEKNNRIRLEAARRVIQNLEN